MAVLLLRLAGPMQSWGTRSRFDDRDTERFPSKSGVIGLVCAALGRPREAPLEDLAALRMAARADLPGRLETDYQTALDVPTASGSGDRTMPSRRHYLADAAFLVGLEGSTPDELSLLGQIEAALKAPVWPLALGRKAFVPGAPVWLPGGLLADSSLEDAMASTAWLAAERSDRGARRSRDGLEVEWECQPGVGHPRSDVPLCFARGACRFGTRYVVHRRVPFPGGTISPTQTEIDEDEPVP